MRRASVVFPEPGGPQKMHDPTSPRRISSPSALPGPSRCSWPRKSSSVVGRMRAARGSAERENSVESDTGDGRREAGAIRRGKDRNSRKFGAAPPDSTRHLWRMRNLESFDAWKLGQDLATLAYQLTLSPKLDRPFALKDQVRRAALSIPANIAEGYALGTTPQFLRCLRIALGSNTELYSHLAVLARLGLVPTNEVHSVIDLCNRVIAMTIGLIRKLSRRRP